MVISSSTVLNSSFNSQESGLVMEAIEATQFNDLNDNLGGIPIPDSGKNAQRNQQRRKKRAQKRVRYDSVQSSFEDFYDLTGEILGEGAYAKVQGCIHKETGKEYAVKTVIKHAGLSRARVFKEIEIFYHCQGHKNIIQLIEFFEEEDKFFLIFEKINGGPLLSHIQRRIQFTENEASLIIKDLASALKFIHQKGIAHRDLKPENILCYSESSVCPVKICDFDLGSKVIQNESSPISTPTLLSPVGSPLFMSPEIASNFTGQATPYDKKTDLWSLGVIMYILLSGNPPFFTECCGMDCGWERGEFCQICQDLLFDSIQEGIYDFPEREWGYISDDAKDLIQHLLMKDPSQRYTAEMVLRHPWISQAPTTLLDTPNIMRKNNSHKDLAAFACGANAIKRILIQQNLSSDFKSTLANHIDEQCIGSYKNSSSLVLTSDSSPTFTLDEDAFFSNQEQQEQLNQVDLNNKRSIESMETSLYVKENEEKEERKKRQQDKTDQYRKPETKTVKWVDLQEEDDCDSENNQSYTNSSQATIEEFKDTVTNLHEENQPIAIKAIVSNTPKKSALKSMDNNKIIDVVEVRKKKKKRPIKTGSTSSSDDSSKDELSDCNNNSNQLVKTANLIDDSDDLEIDELDGYTIDNEKLIDGQQENKSKLQQMLECIENRKRLSYSVSCYVTSNTRNNQTTSLNYPSMKSMLII